MKVSITPDNYTHALYSPWRTHPKQWWYVTDPEVQDYLKLRAGRKNFNFLFLTGDRHFEQVIWADWMRLREYSANLSYPTVVLRRFLAVRTEWSKR